DSLNIDGSSPPGVFVGRIGYPYVSVGPLIPPSHGDTALLDTPEMWIGKSIDDIVDFRSQLVRGKHLVHIRDLESSRIIEATREMALCSSPIDVEAEFLKKPSARLMLDDEVQPFGPTAPLKKIDVGNTKFDQRMEKAYNDTDLRAKEAVLSLFKNGTLVSSIQKAFSVGAFGEGKARRFVPTRWSITAVDSMVSADLMVKMKDFQLINEYLVFESWQLDNRFVVLMIPRAWSYELIEAWYPNTVWNPFGKEVAIMSSSEGYEGRTTYAEIGGCYYAAQLAVNEYLVKERRQARVVILREAHPGYIMPVGVWNVRENVRAALKTAPRKFQTLNEAFEYISTRLVIPKERWIKESAVLKDTLFQRGLEDFFCR
ncbi:MAG: Nre family DNA repair protein, partial [Candidatus Methanoperedens sp.]|nr:Nre family DNA repair protein [Candidatus Methanoperedens sp.]